MKRTAIMIDPATEEALRKIAEQRGIRVRGPGPLTETVRRLVKEEAARLLPGPGAA